MTDPAFIAESVITRRLLRRRDDADPRHRRQQEPDPQEERASGSRAQLPQATMVKVPGQTHIVRARRQRQQRPHVFAASRIPKPTGVREPAVSTVTRGRTLMAVVAACSGTAAVRTRSRPHLLASDFLSV
jgi:hypothetical protein